MDEFTRGLLTGFCVCILAGLVWFIIRETKFYLDFDYIIARDRAERGEQ